MRSLVLAETVVDLVSAAPSASDDGVARPFPGGTGANVAINLTRLGGSAALVSGVGGDRWGDWLVGWLRREQVDLRWFVQSPSWMTPVSTVEVDQEGESVITMEADALPQVLQAVRPKLEQALSTCDALFFASNTLSDPVSREVTLRARDLALEQGKPVLVDFNLRADRWRSPEAAASLFRAGGEGATVLKCNEHEAAVLSGEQDLERATTALLAAGCELVIVTLGARGAVLCDRQGEVTHAEAPRVAVSSTLGAGDALMGALLGLQKGPSFDPALLRGTFQAAVEVASMSTRFPGAVPGDPIG